MIVWMGDDWLSKLQTCSYTPAAWQGLALTWGDRKMSGSALNSEGGGWRKQLFAESTQSIRPARLQDGFTAEKVGSEELKTV